jgi:LPXTG-motif cell wall-anchored protein
MYGLGAFVALLICSAAHASLIAQFTGTTPSGSNTSYNYILSFSPQGGMDRLESGSGTLTPGAVGSPDFITLYDVAMGGTGPNANFVSATAGTGFSLQVQNTGINAAQTLPVDDLNLLNITYAYTGPTITNAETAWLGFSIVVKNNDGTTLKQFTGQYTDNEGLEINTKVSEIGLVAVPKTGISIPEPTAMGLGLIGVFGLMGRRKAHR